MSTWYKVTAFWGGLDGSLLFWVLVLVAVLDDRDRGERASGTAT